MENLIRQLLTEIGEDPNREGLIKTPERVAKAYAFLTRGYQQDPCDIIHSAMFTEKYDEMVIVKYIDFYSLCEHHMLPFYGKVHVAYIPDGQVVGIDNVLARVDEELQRLNGSVTASERLGRRSFARTMQNKDAGQYVKMTLSMEPASVRSMSSRVMPSFTVTSFLLVMTSLTFLVMSVSKRRSRLVTIPTN